LQADGEKGAIAQAFDGDGGRRVEHLAGLALGKGQGEPSSRLMVGRPTSATGLRAAWLWATRCLKSDDSAARRRRMVEACAPSVSRMNLSHAMTARWSTWRSSLDELTRRVLMKCVTSSR
jgi:hypothetical protein